MENAPAETEKKKITDEQRVVELEAILRKNVKTKTLDDETFNYMALLINEDAPKNYNELYDLIIDFLTDGLAYTPPDAKTLCVNIYKIFCDNGLIDADNK